MAPARTPSARRGVLLRGSARPGSAKCRRHRWQWFAAFLLIAATWIAAAGCTGGSDTGDANTPPGSNRLIHEKSPYLLQHAHNPVDWYPWGDDAFARAKQENKPVFLSVGYSTCHWCHVMAHESFENDEIAAYLNQHFVSIKLDREERPDIDHIYMSFVQATTGRGGWPLNVFLTPDRKPFLGGTYFPPRRIGDRPGFLEVLQRVVERWQSDQATIVQSADRVVEQLRQQSRLQDHPGADSTAVGSEVFDAATAALEERFDAIYGGFGRAPKFPRPSELVFLHRQYRRTGDPAVLELSVATLDAIARGGIHDHLGGGFHRYSTDAYWREPHFEKMLYDQAQLVAAFLEAFQLTGNERFAAAARSTLRYVARDMTHADGGFYSAEDADSAEDAAHPDHTSEGAYYVWSYDELARLLDADLLQLATAYYGVAPEGNLHGTELRRKNVLYVEPPLRVVADSLGIDLATAQARLGRLHEVLLQARQQRPRPHVDDKILVDWNGMMISAFARAAQVFGDEGDRIAAERATRFVLERLWDDKGELLLRRWRDGDAAIPALHADYAFFVQGLLDLYETTFDVHWLQWAQRLTDRQIELFADDNAGAFFEVSDAHDGVLVRTKEYYDGAQPTSNSVAALNLLRLGDVLDSQAYRERAQRIFAYFGLPLRESLLALPAMLVALDWSLGPRRQVIIAGTANATDTQRLLRTAHTRFLPRTILLLADGEQGQRTLAEQLPVVANMRPVGGHAAAFVCRDYTCQLPVTDPAALAQQLDATP